MYEFIIVGVIFCAMILSILIVTLLLTIGMRNQNSIKNEKNEERFNILANEIRETQKLFKNEVGEILESAKKIFRREGDV